MKSFWKRICAAGLCLGLLLAGCQSAADLVGEDPSSSPVAKGRYLETRLPFPDLTEVTAWNQVGPDTYSLIGDTREETQVWNSRDGGETWEQEFPSWLEKLEDRFVGAAAVTPTSDVYAFLGKWDENMNLDSRLAYIDERGVSFIGEKERESVACLELTDSGDLLVGCYSGMEQRNLETGKTQTYPFVAGPGTGRAAGVFDTVGDTLAVYTEENTVDLYDLNTGSKTQEIPCKTPLAYERVIALQQDQSAIYYCDSSGLYRMTADGSLTEQLIDGESASFGDGFILERLLHRDDGAFLVLCQNEDNSFELFRYHYDKTAPTAPSQELSVYSLTESMSIQVAIRTMKQKNPDLSIAYQIGIPGGSAITPADAIHTLNTELLAGTGPDVLLLDGLPVESYMEKGVLHDLAGLPGGPLQNQELLTNITGIYSLGGGVYGVPTRFSVPVVCGVAMEEVGGVGDLVTWLEHRESTVMTLPKGGPLELFYDLCSPRWFGEGNALNEQAMRKDLEAMKAYGDLQNQQEAGRAREQTRLMDQAVWWSGDGLAAILGTIRSLEDASYLYSAVEARGDGAVRLFPQPDQGVFFPQDILGVNVAGDQVALAEEFVVTALSKEAQEISIDQGLPVNQEALLTILKGREAGRQFMKLEQPDEETGKTYELACQWFSEESREKILALLRSVTTPANQNMVLREMVFEETEGYFVGSLDLDDTMAHITQKSNHYFAEMQ